MKDVTIIVDTREQQPLWKEGPNIIFRKLEVGDYSLLGYENRFAAERKSPMDLYGSIIQNHKRFRAELVRANEHKIKLEVFVSCTLAEWSEKAWIGGGRVKQDPRVLLKIITTILEKYDTPFHFSGHRDAMRAEILNWLIEQKMEVDKSG